LGQFYEKQLDYRNASLSYKRGYAKIPVGSSKADGFFINIKRIAALLKTQNLQNTQLEEKEEEVEEDAVE